MTDLSDYLRTLHHNAGQPSTRTLARKTGVSHTTIADVLNATRAPSLQLAEDLARVLDGSPDEAKRLWVETVAPRNKSKRAITGLNCALCLYDLQHPAVAPAITVIEGFAVCESHMGYVAQGTRWFHIMEALQR